MNGIKIRKYVSGDIDKIYKLFYDTVHTVNALDYTPAELDAWADGAPDKAKWDKEFTEREALVAEYGGKLAGFADMDSSGYLDRMYVAADSVGKGIGRALLETLEARHPLPVYTTYASITATPFFLKAGYVIIRENTVTRKGVTLKNYLMQKMKPAD